MWCWDEARPRQQTLSKSVNLGENGTTSFLKRIHSTDKPDWENQREMLLQLVLPTAYREVALRGCHDEVGHLGLECMLDLMHDQFFWPCMAAQAKEHVGKCHPCLAFKARQQKAPLKNIMATHPLELVHLDYLCLGAWERAGRKCSGNYRPFHQICPGLCHKDPNHLNNC